MQGRRSTVATAAFAAAVLWLGSSRPAGAITYFTCDEHPTRSYVDDCDQVGVGQGDHCVHPALGCCAPGTCKNDGAGGLFCDPANTEIDCGETPEDNECTNDTCSIQGGTYPDSGYYEAVCNHANNTAACSDDNKCTGTGSSGVDQCSGGSCVSGAPNSNSCDDNNSCTNADQCSGGSCTGTPDANGTSCSDGSGCTSPDTCQNGVCSGPSICNTIQFNLECSTGMACVSGSCKPVERASSDHTTCDDGLECTTFSECFDGECGGQGHRTSGNAGGQCWDHDYCRTPGSCSGSNPNCPTAGRTPLAIGAACDDHNACTQNTTCQCPPGNPPPCNASAGVCTVPASNGCATGTCANCGGNSCVNGTVFGFPCGCTDMNQAVPG